MEISEFLSTVESIHTEARRRKLYFQVCEDDALRGRTLQLHGRELTSFGSCSYLGLEFHPALVEGVVDAVRRYGTQFSYSRAYLGSPQYREAEALLSEIFGGHALIALSTALGHQAALPTIATEKDAIVLDGQVHASVQKAATLAQAGGATVEIVRHYELDEKVLETVERLARKHRTVYFAIDGVYSMYGDCAPIGLVEQVLGVAPNVRVYVDDAHGMSWAGRHGRGWFLSRLPLSERIVFSTSLNKAFSAAGGCFVFSSEAERERVRLCGGPYTFSGPVQPPMLGAICASAALHRTEEITALQRTYRERSDLMNLLMQEHDLPLLSRNESPIFFLRLGKVEAAHALAERMLDEGFYVNTSTYPMVPLKRAGMRITVTALHTPEQIHGVCQALAHHLPRVLEEHGVERAELDELYRKALPSESWGGIDLGRSAARRTRAAAGEASSRASTVVASAYAPAAPAARVETAASIRAVDRAEWDACMKGRGTSSWSSLAMLEEVFREQPRRELNWSWCYLVARDRNGRPVGTTYCVRMLIKDDMWMRPEVSAAVQARRREDPYFLSSDALVLGSGLSEGDHLWVDPTVDAETRAQVRSALLAALEAQAEEWGVDVLVLRDFPGDDSEMDAWMHARDWAKYPILDNQRLELRDTTEEEMVVRAGRYSRKFLRGLIAASGPYQPRVYGVHGDTLPEGWAPHLHRLYLNVAERKLRINDWFAPLELFEQMLSSPAWEVLAVHLPTEAGGPEDGRPVSWAAVHRHEGHYSPFLCGVDYRYVEGREYGAYRQLLLQVTRRGRALGMHTLHLGYDAEQEKHRFGARRHPTCMYVRARNHDHGERLAELVTQVGLSADANRRRA